MKTKEIVVLGILTVLVISIIYLIQGYKSNETIEEETMKCIANQSILIVSKTCGHCANQKQILGEYINEFDIIYLEENPELWKNYNLQGVPTWIINNRSYPGVRQIKKLKEISGC